MAFTTAPSVIRHPRHQPPTPSRSRRRAPPRACHSAHSLDISIDALRQRNLPPPSPQSTVYLVGTGPGDPSLLTLRAVELMRSADVVLYDRLVSDAILRYVNPSARMIYVGKQAGFHTRPQQDIHLLLRAFATQGRTVVRLKGGDPFVFGRGGEETEFLENHGIQVRAVPGITAASGIGAELGIPLTHRGIAHSVRFLTGHARDGAQLQLGNVDDGTTLVIYMGLGQLPLLVQRFMQLGLSDNVPAVAVERGTTPEQRVVWANVATLQEKVDEAALNSPTLIIIGHVVALATGWQREMGADVSHPDKLVQQNAKEMGINTTASTDLYPIM